MVAKPAKTKTKLPISRHPLFAPMVAMWFATLFGLGSLAVRPTLLEAFVLALRIDLVIPAAAPPLGFTFRILLALGLFVIGGAIGFLLVRRFTRPAQVKTEGRSFIRKGAKAEGASVVATRGESPDDDDDFARLDSARQTQEETANAGPTRRRSLAMDEDFQNDYRDFVPLPGGDPQILDLAELGPISEYEEPEQAFDADGTVEAQQFDAVSFEREDTHFEVQSPREFAAAAEAAAEANVTEEQEPDFDPWRRHPAKVVFQPMAEAEAVGVPVEPDFSQPAPFAAPFADQQRAFAPPAADFSAPAPFAAPQQFQPEPAFEAPAAAQEEAPALRETPVRADFSMPAHEPLFARPAPEAAQSEVEAEPEVIESLTAEPAVETPVAAPVSAPVFGQVSGDAAERLVAVPVGSLGVVQLAERLALAIARKRSSANANATAAEEESPLLAAPSPPVPVAAPLPPSFAAPQVPVQVFQPEVPAKAEPEDADLAEAEPAESGLATYFATPPAQPPAMPAAFRPLSFGDDEDEPLDAFVPPRRFAMPEAEAPAPVAFAPEQPAPDFSAPSVQAQAEPEQDEDDGYASLLGMKPQGRPFVRIDEPEPETTAIEPVVIFPGQDTRPAFHQSQAVAAAPEAGFGGGIRPFDAPQAGSVTPVRMPAVPAPAIDPAETERQLKAALATLQRMSGAA